MNIKYIIQMRIKIKFCLKKNDKEDLKIKKEENNYYKKIVIKENILLKKIHINIKNF